MAPNLMKKAGSFEGALATILETNTVVHQSAANRITALEERVETLENDLSHALAIIGQFHCRFEKLEDRR